MECDRYLKDQDLFCERPALAKVTYSEDRFEDMTMFLCKDHFTVEVSRLCGQGVVPHIQILPKKKTTAPT